MVFIDIVHIFMIVRYIYRIDLYCTLLYYLAVRVAAPGVHACLDKCHFELHLVSALAILICDRVENSTLAAHNSQSFLLEMIWVVFRPQAQRGILHQLHWAHLFLLDACHIGHGASLQSPILCKKATRREIKFLVKKAHRRASRNPQCLLCTKNLNLSNFSPEKSTCDRCVRAIYCLHHKLITQISSNWFPIGAGIPGKSTVTKKHTQWILQNHHEIPWNQYFLGLRPSMKNHRNIRLASEMVSQ